MASLKNFSKSNQRLHRERDQPAERRHLVALEKKKDYKQRANDFQHKRDQLKILRRKALERNPDEFYFHMVNSKLDDGGAHREKETDADEDTPEQKQLMESQDLRYVDFKHQTEKRKVDKLKSTLHMTDLRGRPRNTHVVFVDSPAQAVAFDPAAYLETHSSLVDRVHNRPRLRKLEQAVVHAATDKISVNQANTERKQLYAELAKRVEREKELGVVAAKLRAKVELSKKSKHSAPPKKVKRGNARRAPVFVWPLERKR